MKQNRQWGKVLWIILLLSVIILVVLLVAQLSEIKQQDEIEPAEKIQESTEDFSQEESQTKETWEEISTEAVTEKFEEVEQGYIIIGDSHIVVTDGMGYSIYGSHVEGVGLNKNLFAVHTGLDPVMGTIEWLEGDGAEQMKEIIMGHPEISKWDIISMHGTSMVTMPDITERYINNYQKWIDESFCNCHVYIVSVPPLDEKEWVVRHPDMPRRSNQDIVQFNDCIKNAFPDNYFDYYDWFLEHGDSFQDEIHYTGETYCEMFDEIIETLRQK